MIVHLHYVLQCILFSFESTCPSRNCKEQIEDENRKWFQAIWDKHYTEYKPTDVSVLELETGKPDVLYVTVLNGDAAEIEFIESWTVLRLMTEIKKVLKLEINEQRLLYSGKELNVSPSKMYVLFPHIDRLKPIGMIHITVINTSIVIDIVSWNLFFLLKCYFFF